jgi:hypothetical protein
MKFIVSLFSLENLKALDVVALLLLENPRSPVGEFNALPTVRQVSSSRKLSFPDPFLHFVLFAKTKSPQCRKNV